MIELCGSLFGIAILAGIFLAAVGTVISLVLLVTGHLFEVFYWLWGGFEERVLGKKRDETNGTKIDYSIDQGKQVE